MSNPLAQVGEGIMDRAYRLGTYIFDPLHHYWENDRTQRAVAGGLVAVFILGLIGIELNRQGMLPPGMSAITPTSHYMAINLAFSLVLVLEVVSLIFTIPCSISKSVGKQFEILALILLRGSFKELADFPEPILLTGHMDALLRIVSDATGALIIFGILGVYIIINRQLDDEARKGEALFRFVAAKKIVALCLFGIFVFLGAKNVFLFATSQPTFEFFHAFFTVLIFSDILLVLVSQRFLPQFRAVFRNSGFALATLLIRLALTAPKFYDALIGIGAVVYAVLLTLVYNAFFSRFSKKGK